MKGPPRLSRTDVSRYLGLKAMRTPSANEILHSGGLKPTGAREALVTALLDEAESDGVDSQRLLQLVIFEQSAMSVATFYRILRELQQARIIERREPFPRLYRYFLRQQRSSA